MDLEKDIIGYYMTNASTMMGILAVIPDMEGIKGLKLPQMIM